MKKILVLGLALTLVLSLATMASAVTVTPEVEGMYWGRGNAFAFGGGAIINMTPQVGLRARAGYVVNSVKGYIILIDGLYSIPIAPKVDLSVGGGMNYYNSGTALVGGGIGGQFYAGITGKVSSKLGIFVDVGWINTSTSIANTRANDYGLAFGIKASLGGE